MYAYIKGRLEAKGNDYIIVEAGGIGYRINTSLSTIEAAGQTGNEFKAFTHLYVREDIMSLFGFATQEELGMFELLLTVSGVGPKAALALLSAVSPSKFGLAVITDDTKTLTRAQGVGAKLAQRIILELKDKIKKEQLAMASGNGFDKAEMPREGSRVSEAVSALMVLGYTPAEASKAVASVYSDDLDLETIIRNSLKGLMR
ncbi:MAG TPA: Holliday junction branch migration protein RuvA [Clostridia bacterium]|nr:Holliday junction branch migration protein RuvA [Clostridia bacterium]